MSGVLLILAGLAMPVSRPSVTVQPRAEVRGKVVRLGDVAKLRGFGKAAKAKAAKISLGKAPAPGQGKLLTKAWLRVKLAEALPRARLKLPSRLEVSRKAQIIKGKDLRERVMAAAKGSSASADPSLSRRGGSIASVSVQRVPDLLVPEGAKVSVTYDGKVGRIAVRDGKDVIQRRQVSVRVDRMVTAWVPKASHRRGDRLSMSDLERVQMAASKVPGDAIQRGKDAAGALVRRPLRAGKPLRAGSLELPALVERGARVRLIARRGTIELTARGEALQRGLKGERVRVRNIGSRKVVSGVVMAPNTVVMEY